jgi:prepilin-type N-terminal cleavage/methylation domain-containing protein
MKKGFTLVETLVGIFIFTILSLAIYQGYLSVLDLTKRQTFLAVLSEKGVHLLFMKEV